MFKKLKRIKPRNIFFVLVIYIFAMSLWWIYLLIDKNTKLYAEKFELQKQIVFNENQIYPLVELSPIAQQLSKKMERQNIMIMSEGFVFLLLLAFGSYKIYSYLDKEITLNQKQRNFLLSITHELRSPLTGIQLSVETVKNRFLDKEKQNQLLTNALTDVDRLKGLVNNLLMGAKIERETIKFATNPINISKLIKTISHHFEQINKNKRKIIVTTPNGIYVKGDKSVLTSIFTNLIDNAIKYSTEKATIFIDAQFLDNNFTTKIIDEGVGVPSNEQHKIFDKFYRIGSEDTRNTIGTGLGLYIVKELVELNKGKINYKANEPKGSIFIVELPAFAEQMALKNTVQKVA